MVGIIAVLVDKVLNITKGFKFEGLKHRQIRHHRNWEYLCLVDGSDAAVQTVKGLQIKIAPERLGRQRYVIEFAILYQCQHLTAIVGRAWDRLDMLYEETERLFKRVKASKDICELRNMINVGYLITRWALECKECRGLHYTTDYPVHAYDK